MENNTICNIPVSATFKVIDGEMVMTSADYREIPADAIARFLIEKFGMTPIFKGGDSD